MAAAKEISVDAAVAVLSEGFALQTHCKGSYQVSKIYKCKEFRQGSIWKARLKKKFVILTTVTQSGLLIFAIMPADTELGIYRPSYRQSCRSSVEKQSSADSHCSPS